MVFRRSAAFFFRSGKWPFSAHRSPFELIFEHSTGIELVFNVFEEKIISSIKNIFFTLVKSEILEIWPISTVFFNFRFSSSWKTWFSWWKYVKKLFSSKILKMNPIPVLCPKMSSNGLLWAENGHFPERKKNAADRLREPKTMTRRLRTESY